MHVAMTANAIELSTIQTEPRAFAGNAAHRARYGARRARRAADGVSAEGDIGVSFAEGPSVSDSEGATSMRTLDGKVAWITGAGTGIGEATARLLALAGMTVVLSGRRAEPLEDVAETIRSSGGRADVIPLDVADRAAVFDAAATIDHAHGRLDVLFANAGTNLTPRNWSDAIADPAVLDDWDAVIDANVKGVYYGIAAVLPAMRREGDGLVVITSSWAGRFYSQVAGVAYGASKHAVMSLSAHLNMQEGANGIRACAICPGEVATPILDRRPVKLTPEELEKLIQPEDIAEAVLFAARMHPRTSVHEILVAPTWPRAKT